jgi:hypothetical protein
MLADHQGRATARPYFARSFFIHKPFTRPAAEWRADREAAGPAALRRFADMNRTFIAALGLAGLGAIGATVPAQAAPVPGSVAALGTAAAKQVTTVQHRRWGGGGRYYRGGGRYYGRGYWRGGGYGWGWGGFAAGALLGAAATAPYWYGPGYGYYYGPPAYYYGPPAVYAPPARGGSCWIATDTTRGYGYWGPC